MFKIDFDYKGAFLEWAKIIEEGNQAFAQRRYSQAELSFAEALKLAQSWPHSDQEMAEQELETRLAKSFNNLAALYHTQGKYSMAEELYEKSLMIKKKLHGEEHEEVALNIQNLGALYGAKRQYAEAERMLKQALNIKEKILGAEHPDLITTLQNYSMLLKKLDRNQEATEIDARVEQIANNKGQP